MKIKTAIIILASLAIATGLFFVYLFITIKKTEPQPVIKTISTEKGDFEVEIAPGDDEAAEIEAAKQEMLEERKLEIMNNLKNNVSTTTVEETPEEKTEKINKMMDILTR